MSDLLSKIGYLRNVFKTIERRYKDGGEVLRPCETGIEMSLVIENEIQSLESQNRKYRVALESIAKNTCCNNCQEAALVAQQALEVEGE